MLNIKDLRDPKQTDTFKQKLARKGVDASLIDTLLAADKTHREYLQVVESLAAKQNEVSKKIPSLSGEAKKTLLAEMKIISSEKKAAEAKQAEAKTTLYTMLRSLPNPPYESAPDGKDDTDNIQVNTWGEKPVFDFEPKEHWEIAEALDLLDTERSAKVSGARFYYMKNELAILQRALIFWAFMEVQKKFGFTPMIPPFMTRKEAIQGTGFFDKDENYCVNPGEDDLYLIGTSEVPVTSYYANEILDEADMPQKFVAHSPCFRREAGSYGKDTKGIFRVHQFEKVEMVIFCDPAESSNMHEHIREIEEHLLQSLGIHYQVMNVCCGDLGSSAAKKYDLEAWLPGQNQYREMTSTSICTDYQTRRLKTRIRKKDGSIVHAHTLNGTAVSSRPLVAIIENFQQADGSVIIPEVLRGLCGFDRIG
jgi:seryl-tRNA synthetase